MIYKYILLTYNKKIIEYIQKYNCRIFPTSSHLVPAERWGNPCQYQSEINFCWARSIFFPQMGTVEKMYPQCKYEI